MKRKKIIWVDGLAGLTVGIFVLSLSLWLGRLYDLPVKFLIFMGIVNLAYGLFSTSLAFRNKRPLPLIVMLAFANMIWAIVCFALVVYYFNSATPLAIFHFGFEGIFVGGLGVLEWRWRKDLQTA